MIYSSTVTTQLSVSFLSESVIQKRVKYHCTQHRQFRPFQICFHYFHAISGFVFKPTFLNPGSLENPK